MELLLKKTNETCTVKGCNVRRADGDLLFCSDCRGKWIEVCKKDGIHEKTTSERDIWILLNNYQKDGKGWAI